MRQHIFLLVKSAPIYLIGRDFFETVAGHISFSQKCKMYLKLNESDTEPTGKIMILKEFPQEEINLETESLL